MVHNLLTFIIKSDYQERNKNTVNVTVNIHKKIIY